MLVLSNDNWNSRTSTANLDLAPGWHTIEIRISNGTGGSGPASGIGIGYDPAGGTNWQTLVDPGDGSFLKANQQVPRAEASLNGTVSDLDGDPFTTTWSKVFGPGSVTFADASAIDTTAQFDAWGTYTLRLTGDDGRGPIADDVIITVNAPDFDLTYDGNGNTGGTIPADQIKSHGIDLTLSDGGDLSRTGYAFAGWNTESDGSGTSYAASATYSVNAALTLYAQWNSSPTVDAGAPQTVYLGSSGQWSPSNITTLAWYDAADAETITAVGGTVSQWNDKSGNSRNIAQTDSNLQPGYASNTVSFDGADDYLWNDTTFMYANGQLDVFVVAGIAPTSDDRLLSEGSSTSNQPLYCIAQTDNSDASVMSVYIRSNTGGVLSGQPGLSSTGAFNDTRQIYQWRDTGSQVSGRINGAAETASAYTRSGTFTLNRFSMGAILRSGGSNHINADVNEIVICNNLSNADRQRMEGYLAHKWGLAGNLPVDHPYKEAAPGSPAATATLDGTVNDAEGDLTTVAWTKQPGGPASSVEFTDAVAEDTTVTFFEQGVYTLRLTADDGTSESFDECTITVSPAALFLSIAETEVSENGGTTIATVTRTGSGGNLEVTLSSSDPGEATIPGTVTIPDGETSADVTITGVPDGIVDGNQSVTITASADGYTDGTDTLEVTNFDVLEDFGGWISGFEVGGLTSISDDYDGDGIPNAVENYFGTDPGIYNAGLSAIRVTTSGNMIFEFKHPLNDQPATDLTASYRWSHNLAEFHGHGETSAGTTVTFSVGDRSDEGEVTVTATITGTPIDCLFVTVEVTQQ